MNEEKAAISSIREAFITSEPRYFAANPIISKEISKDVPDEEFRWRPNTSDTSSCPGLSPLGPRLSLLWGVFSRSGFLEDRINVLFIFKNETVHVVTIHIVYSLLIYPDCTSKNVSRVRWECKDSHTSSAIARMWYGWKPQQPPMYLTPMS